MNAHTHWSVEFDHRPRVVLADDDDEIRAMVSAALRQAGHRVAEARSGLELLSVLASVSTQELSPPDVIVSDVRMPMFSGIDALRNARGSGLDVPFILITAFRDAAVEAQAERLGAFALFEKPFDVELLLREVGSAIAQSQALF